jgi:hypothetical protein
MYNNDERRGIDMETMKVKTRIGNDGILKLEVPTGLADREVEVVLVVQAAEPQAVDENGWPIGFFERTYGALADDPLELPPQLPL